MDWRENPFIENAKEVVVDSLSNPISGGNPWQRR
jgi:hypothetical protein